MMSSASSSSSSSSSSSPSSSPFENPSAVRKKDAYLLRKPYPPVVPVAQNRRKSSPLAVGFLCLLLQHWTNLDLRGGGTNRTKLWQALRNQLPQVPRAFKPLAVSILLWVEQKIAAFRMALLEPPPSEEAPANPPPSPSTPPPRTRPATPATHASSSFSSAVAVAAAPVVSGGGPDSSNDDADVDDLTAPTPSPALMSSSSSQAAAKSLPSPSHDPPEEFARCHENVSDGGVSHDPAQGGDTDASATPPTSHVAASVAFQSQHTPPPPESVRREGGGALDAETGSGEGGDIVVSVNSQNQSVVSGHGIHRGGGNGVAPADRDDTAAVVVVVPDPNATAVAALFRAAQLRHRHIQAWIHQVLTYWFGSGSPGQMQKQLWMVPAGSPHRPHLDADIAHRFGTLLVELACDTEFRFSEWTGYRPGSVDNAAPPPARDDDDDDDEPMKGRPLHDDDNNNNDDDAFDAHCVYGFHGKIAAIVVLDQFSRHIWRHQHDNPLATPMPNLPPQAELDRLAYRTAKLLADHHGPELRSGMVPLPMHIFALMPLRHAGTLEAVQSVQDQIAHLDVLVRDGDAMVRRFRNATNRRLAHLQDQQRREGDPNLSSDVLDADILEHSSFQACLTASRIHPIHQTITAFLADRGIHPLSKSSYLHRTPPGTPIIVSLSGGVDSMVIAAVLSYLSQACLYHLHLIAVHIDYGNRPESAAEADFVRRFCADLHMEFHCRRIDEVTRGVTARDEYERISRRARYDMYRQAAQRACEGRPEEGSEVGVVLGHHRGDLRENVLSNAHRGCGPLDLSGMTAVSRNDGVTLYRPLLAMEKDAVYDYAHRFGVPYFKDTTPHWSTRGKLRNKLLPLLEEIYGEGAMTNLSTLAIESDACRFLMHSVAFRPFLDQVQHKPMGITFCTHEWKQCDMFFWKFVLREALHSAGLGMFSEKSVATFLERVQALDVREGWLQCRKDYATYLRCDGQVFVLYPASFPWSTSFSCKTAPETQAIGPEHSRQIGPWVVQACVVETTEDRTATELLARKGVSTMEDFMDGRVQYYIKARTWKADSTIFAARPLLFTTFSKSSRPLAWKNTDAKIQEKLPLLGCDDVTRAAIDDPFGTGAVHTDASGSVVANPIVLICVTLRLQSLVQFPQLLGSESFSACERLEERMT